MKTTELKELMPPHVVDVQGHGINEFYTPEQVVEILRLLGVRQQRELLIAYEKTVGSMDINDVEKEVDKYLKDKNN